MPVSRRAAGVWFIPVGGSTVTRLAGCSMIRLIFRQHVDASLSSHSYFVVEVSFDTLSPVQLGWILYSSGDEGGEIIIIATLLILQCIFCNNYIYKCFHC